jgi:hypothetical protein
VVVSAWNLGVVTWRVSSRLPGTLDDHLQTVMGYLVAASRRPHHVDANLVVAARGYRNQVTSRRQNILEGYGVIRTLLGWRGLVSALAP